MPEQTRNKEQEDFKLPAVSLPKGGGSIHGMGEKFSVNSVSGTASFSVPISIPQGRQQFTPQLSLNYNSGSGNSIFGLGWSMDFPSISRKTSKGIPTYKDAEESDTFLISDAEDLVPYLEKDGEVWNTFERTEGDYKVKRYRPRTEGSFSKIEKLTHNSSGEIYWRITTKTNITHIYGSSANCRLADPADNSRVFQWFIQQSYDTKGNFISYEYKEENTEGVSTSLVSEKNRMGDDKTLVNLYPKTVYYGNKISGDDSAWHFKIVFDYGEHDEVNPGTGETTEWLVRKDPFSSCRSGFEIRTYRLCKRVLIFHNFNELGADDYLTRSIELTFAESAEATLLSSITQKGHKQTASGQRVLKSLPPLQFAYSSSVISTDVHEIDESSLNDLPAGTSIDNYQWIDLHGEGIAGLLATNSGEWYYKPNSGEGSFAPLMLVSEKPVPSSSGNVQPMITDIDGDSHYELVLRDNLLSGYFRTVNGKWQNFLPFADSPNINWDNPDLRFIDIDADGITDVLITEGDQLKWYISKGTEGFEPARYAHLLPDEEHNPVVLFGNKEEAILLASMKGDGLTDIVRVRNSEICYWPNMGHGRFGKKVTMVNPPFFDHPDLFNIAQLRLGDIDGSGTTDIIYIYHDRVKYWINQSGNSWGQEQNIGSLPFSDNTSSVFVQDILGTGTACLVWSSPDPVTGTLKLKYVDLLNSRKANLLSVINNNMGKEISMVYDTSTKFYLDDNRKGTPWITKLPFPVHVISGVITTDHISSSALVTTYKYHHGYYDGEEKEFRGFGMVEQTDAESFETYTSGNELDMPPVFTKSWFHTGYYSSRDVISRQYATEYFGGDLKAHIFPDSIIEADSEMDYRALREAHRSLRGRVLRVEIYAKDGSIVENIPYQVTESNYKVQQLQAVFKDKCAVYHVSPSETLTYSYERNVPDPRIAHSITLETDEYGNILKSVNIVYPRRSEITDAYPEQRELHITAQLNEYIHHTDDFYLLGIPKQSRSFEINGLDPGTDSCFSCIEIKTSLLNIFEPEALLKHNQSFGSGVQARLIGWTKNYYCGDDSLVLSSGAVNEKALLHHTEQVIMSEEWVGEVYSAKVSFGMMEEAGYTLSEGYWWRPGPVIQYFDSAGFYLSFKTIDPFGNETAIVYDNYFLLPVKQVDALGNTTSSEVDYQTLVYSKVTDINGNSSEILTDAMGMVIATSMYGTTDGELEGDEPLDNYEEQEETTLENIIANPENYLQAATTFFYYDLEAWINNGEPPRCISLSREVHMSKLGESETSPIQIFISYSDGFGRELQSKVKVDDGPLTDESAEIAERWLVSGRKVYNNKQKPVKQYEPFYSEKWRYQSEEEVAAVGVTPIIYYDPMGRVFRTETPKGFFSKVEFDSWKVSTWDENDTIKDSLFYNIHSYLIGTGNEEGEALKKGEAHYGTPTIATLDTLGRQFMITQYKESDGDPLSTLNEFDIQGNILSATDPRQVLANQSRTEEDLVHNFVYLYELQGNILYTDSGDAGESWGLINVTGNPVHSWNSRGYHNQTFYDALLRPVEVKIDGNGLDQTVQMFEYGEGEVDPENKNLRGQVVRQYDEAGISESRMFDIKANLLSASRSLRSEYKIEANWNDIASVTMESESFDVNNSFDVLGRIIDLQKPDGSITRNTYHQSGWLKTVEVRLKNDSEYTSFISGIEYNAKGQRTKIIYGNGVHTAYSYEADTFRLSSLKTTRREDNGSITILQDITYVYDPVGNIVKITDHSFETIFTANQEVEPVCSYTYDALYQLTEATGREHMALNKTDYQLGTEGYKSSHFVSINDAGQLRNYTEHYTYDHSGNLTEIQHTGENSYTRKINASESSNRCITDEMNTSVEVESCFDSAGNMLSLEHLQNISWNYRNNISSVTIIERDTENDSEYYVYDNGGQRVRKVKETFDSSGSLLWKEEKIYIGGIELKRRYQGSDETLKEERFSHHAMDDLKRIAIVYYWTQSDSSNIVVDNNKIHYQLGNHLGSASLELDIAGQLISYEEYLPYGGTAFTSGNNEAEVKLKEYRYTGKERDDTTGMYYYGARYYVPWLGRWLSTDPKGTIDGLNLYRYVRNNPVMLIDPQGTTPLKYSEAAFSADIQNLCIQNCVPFSTEVTFSATGGGGNIRGDIILPKGSFWRNLTIFPEVTYEELKTESGKFTDNQLGKGIDSSPEGVVMQARSDRAGNLSVSHGQTVIADVHVTRPSTSAALEERIIGKGIVREATKPLSLSLALDGFDDENPSTPSSSASVSAKVTQAPKASLPQTLSQGIPKAATSYTAVAVGASVTTARVFVPGFVEAEVAIQTTGMLTMGSTASIPVVGEVSYLAATAPTAVTSVATGSAATGLVVGYGTGRLVEPPVTSITGSKTAGTIAATAAGATTGAVAGAAVGAAIGVWGFGIAAVPAAAVGAVAGGIAGGIGGYLSSYW